MIKQLLRRAKELLLKDLYIENENQKLLMGKILVNQIKAIKKIQSLQEVEFKVFSQFGDDGIIQWLINNLDIQCKTFIEFGVEDYKESNTRFLMMNDNWDGFVMDGNDSNIENLQAQYYYWKYNLKIKAVFIKKSNINHLIQEQGYSGEIGVLHIDLDGNDYYIWKQINVISPIIVIVEYNSIFGFERPISTPYQDDFIRTNYHYSNLFWGSSLKSLYLLAQDKGYSFIGCNSSGNNAYFVRNDKLNDIVKKVSLNAGFVESKYRESCDQNGNLTFLSKTEGKKLLAGLQVFNTVSNKIESF